MLKYYKQYCRWTKYFYQVLIITHYLATQNPIILKGNRRQVEKGEEGSWHGIRDAGKVSEMSAQGEMFILKMRGSVLNAQLALLFIWRKANMKDKR